jgi:hypothetical protein
MKKVTAGVMAAFFPAALTGRDKTWSRRSPVNVRLPAVFTGIIMVEI